MPEKLQFEIPNDSEAVVKLLEAVPDDWKWVDGCLQAPASMIKDGEAVQSVHLHASRDSITTTFAGSDSKEIFKFVLERKYAGSIRLGLGGLSASFPFVKEIVIAFLRLGYHGSLRISKPSRHNSREEDAAFLYLFFTLRGEQSYAKLVWDKSYGGNMLTVAPIAAICSGLGLKDMSSPRSQ